MSIKGERRKKENFKGRNLNVAVRTPNDRENVINFIPHIHTQGITSSTMDDGKCSE